MVSQSRLYLVLLASMATMAFWLGLWGSAVQTYQEFREPKPIGMLFYMEQEKERVSNNVNRNIKQTFNHPSQITTQHRKEQHKTSKIPLPKPKFGQKHAPPVAKSVFSFASMRPGSKNGPFSYAAKLIGYRLAMEQKKRTSSYFNSPPHSLIEIPKIEAKWKIAPEYKISDKIPVENARNVLIATSWRFGSTFLGDLLNHYPGTFYSFEPLHYLSNRERTKGKPWNLFQPLDALKFTRDVFNCDYTNNITTGYLKHASRSENQFLLKHNFRIWNSCSTLLPSSVACFMPELMKKSCNLFPIRLIKTVRLRVRFIEELLQQPDLNLKVIVLVRDPRGVMRSRSHMNWCDQPTCANSSRVCEDLDSDIENSWNLGKTYGNRIILIRYEDLSIQPYKTVDRLINFLDLPPQPDFIDTYLETHTGQLRKHELTYKKHKENKETPYSTKRKSSEETAFKWMESLSEEEIHEIQDVCAKPMNKLGYATFSSDITNHREILVKSADEVWPYKP